jgi:hypothetical protein
VVQIVACERKVVGEGFAVWRSIGRWSIESSNKTINSDLKRP